MSSGDWRDTFRKTTGRLPALARAHAVFLALLAAGTALRIVTLIAYRPALFSPDSAGYIDAASGWTLPAIHPVGYSLFLKAVFTVWDEYLFVPILQHLLGLGMAFLIYATLCRLGVRQWLAAVAAAPVLLDAYQLNIEQYVLSDTLFQFAIVAGCAALLWRQPLELPLAGLAGALFAAAAVTRAVGVLMIVPLVLAVVVLRPQRMRAVALVGAFLLPLIVYGTVFKATQGTFSLTAYQGRYLYGRVIDWVDCKEFSVPEHERVLCPGEHEELEWTYQYLWTKQSPLWDVRLPPGQDVNDVAGDFAGRAIFGQPLTYARTVAADSLMTFSPTKHDRQGEFRVGQWQFQLQLPIAELQSGWRVDPPKRHPHGIAEGTINRDLASFLRNYQRFSYVPGPLLAACLLVALAGAIGIGRARHAGLRGPTAIFLALGVVLCVGSVASTMFAWRYQLPQLILLPPAAALAIESYLRRPGERSVAAGSARRDSTD